VGKQIYYRLKLNVLVCIIS